MENPELEGGLEVLEADLAETENSVYHLVRSNVELAQVCSHGSKFKSKHGTLNRASVDSFACSCQRPPR